MSKPIDQLKQVLEELLELQVAKEQLQYLHKGIGVKTPNAAWLKAEKLIRDLNQ